MNSIIDLQLSPFVELHAVSEYVWKPKKKKNLYVIVNNFKPIGSYIHQYWICYKLYWYYIESIIGLFKNECNDHYYIITILNSARFVRRKRIIGWCPIHKYDESDEKGQRKGRCRNIPAVNRYRCLLGIYNTAGLRSDIYHIDIYCHLYIPIYRLQPTGFYLTEFLQLYCTVFFFPRRE